MTVKRFTTFIIQVILVLCKMNPASASTQIASSDTSSNENPLIGNYKLEHIVYVNGTDVHLPSGYTVSISSVENKNVNPLLRQEFIFRLNIKVGNMIGGRLTLQEMEHLQTQENDGIQEREEFAASVSQLFSTKMMVPPDIGLVEKALHEILPTTDTLSVDGNIVTFHGMEGHVSVRRD